MKEFNWLVNPLTVAPTMWPIPWCMWCYPPAPSCENITFPQLPLRVGKRLPNFYTRQKNICFVSFRSTFLPSPLPARPIYIYVLITLTVMLNDLTLNSTHDMYFELIYLIWRANQLILDFSRAIHLGSMDLSKFSVWFSFHGLLNFQQCTWLRPASCYSNPESPHNFCLLSFSDLLDVTVHPNEDPNTSQNKKAFQ